MKKTAAILILILSIVLVGCSSSSSNKILGFIELNQTPESEIIDNLNLEAEYSSPFDPELGIYVYHYIWHYADYALNNVNGIIHIYFEDETAKFVNFSAESTKENMEKISSYLIKTYGKNYKNLEDYTTRWTSGDLIIDYFLTDEDTVEIIWYIE